LLVDETRSVEPKRPSSAAGTRCDRRTEPSEPTTLSSMLLPTAFAVTMTSTPSFDAWHSIDDHD
jgi:hypothetical protein